MFVRVRVFSTFQVCSVVTLLGPSDSHLGCPALVFTARCVLLCVYCLLLMDSALEHEHEHEHAGL